MAACRLARSARAVGFSLIELVAVVAVVAILALIALPSYRSTMLKSRRVEGKTLLQTTMAAEERYYASTNRYSSDPGSSGLSIPVQSVPGAYYTLTTLSVSDDAQTVSLAVAPQRDQLGDVCGNLTLDSLGRHGCGASACSPADCW